MWQRRYFIAITAIIFLGLLIVMASIRRQPIEPPNLLFDGSVAGDFQDLAEETWQAFLIAFEGRIGCFSDVTLKATETLGNRALYDPATSTVTVRVPATPALLKGALIHEWAHHLEIQCEAHQQMREPFLLAQGLTADTAWRPEQTYRDIPSSQWASIPSEQYAEAAIIVVLGARQIPTLARVSPEAIEVVRAWAAGKSKF